MNTWIILAVTVALGLSAWEDYKTEEISLVSVGLMILTKSVFILLNPEINTLYASFVGLGISAFPFLIMAILGKGGIGDILLMGALGFAVGIIPVIRIILIASIIYILFGMYQIGKMEPSDNRVKEGLKTQYPYAPSVFIAWIIYLGFLLIRR